MSVVAALPFLALLLSAPALSAQTPQPPSDIPDKPTSEPLPPSKGKVLFSTEQGAPPAAAAPPASSSSQPDEQPEPGPPDQRPAVLITNQERSGIGIVSERLDLHLIPASAREEVQAELTVQNQSNQPISRIPLQLSSTLRWQSVSIRTPSGLQPLVFTQSPIATDADHTGYAQEAVLTPREPLQPHESVTLSVFYTGTIRQSGARLELIGAPPEKARDSDWDQIVPTSDAAATSLRGFGDVLWYPVAAPTAAFGEGNTLFELIRRERPRSGITSLHLTVDYVGDPPDGAIFNGTLQPLAKVADTNDQLVAETHGVATADFAPQLSGPHTPSLFLTAQEPVTTDDELLTVVTPNEAAAVPYAEAAAGLASQLKTWLGAGPRVPMLLLDHAGEPFEDGGFLAGKLSATAKPEAVAPELIRGLTHAWFDPAPLDPKTPDLSPLFKGNPSPNQPVGGSNAWLFQGVAELMALISTENLLGRDAAIAQLQQAYVLLGLSEPVSGGVSSSNPAAASPPAAPQPAKPGPVEPQPLIAAYSDVYLRYKSLSVLWQLREQLGEPMLEECLSAYRHSVALNPALATDWMFFEKSIEKTSGRELRWFFEDWVYRDKGLPDLALGEVNARPLPVGTGKYSGYLVAVEVKNLGGAVADVPVTVSNDTLTATQRIRVPAHAEASVRIVFEGVPQTVQVNDGSVPEAGALVHTVQVKVEPGS
jgi:hypothetical protein